MMVEATMQTQLELAEQTLFSHTALHVRDFKMFPGTSRDVTDQQMAAEINSVLAQLAAGATQDITDCED